MIKVSELSGAQLDMWVSRADRIGARIELIGGVEVCVFGESGLEQTYSPSSDWSQGGPIQAREKIDVMWCDDGESWMAEKHDYPHDCYHYGQTPLIAAMRCYVCSKFGEAVPVHPARTVPLETLIEEFESDPEMKLALNEARKNWRSRA